MIEDATSERTARFVRQDSSEENLRLLWSYLERNGRPVAFYTDKASLFHNTPKTRRDGVGPQDQPEMAPTQIGRALRELGIDWIAAHSPQAKGRVERSFGTAQDRLVKGLGVAGVTTPEQANRFLEQDFLPWWEQHLTVLPANTTDAPRPLGPEHDLAAALKPGGNAVCGQRLHLPVRRPVVPDCAAGYPPGPARQPGAVGSPARRLAGRAVPGSLSVGNSLAEATQGSGPTRGTACKAPASHQPRPRPVPLDLRHSLPIWKAAAMDQTRTRDTLD